LLNKFKTLNHTCLILTQQTKTFIFCSDINKIILLLMIMTIKADLFCEVSTQKGNWYFVKERKEKEEKFWVFVSECNKHPYFFYSSSLLLVEVRNCLPFWGLSYYDKSVVDLLFELKIFYFFWCCKQVDLPTSPERKLNGFLSNDPRFGSLVRLQSKDRLLWLDSRIGWMLWRCHLRSCGWMENRCIGHQGTVKPKHKFSNVWMLEVIPNEFFHWVGVLFGNSLWSCW